MFIQLYFGLLTLMFMSWCKIHAQSKKKFADKQSIRCYMLKTTGE